MTMEYISKPKFVTLPSIFLLIVVVSGAMLFGACNNTSNKLNQNVKSKDAKSIKPAVYEKTDSTIYKNTQYGFNFSLPKTWKGYTIITDKWDGLSVSDLQSSKTVESGPIINIRHPEWTSQNKRQDIPIMIFTIKQWDALLKDEFHIGAAPIGPKELGRNSKYVFALPARYNFAFPTGYQEVENILNSNSLKPTEDYNPKN